MAFPREPSAARGPGPSLGTNSTFMADDQEWVAPENEPRDIKKLCLVVGLGALSWVATYVGMLELIQSNMGDLPIVHKIIIGFSVAMLMTMIIWLLDQLFSPINFTTKLAYIMGYIFLTLISVGFGFGFYWKVLESRSEATRSAESAISQVQLSLHAGSTRLEQLNTTLLQLTQISKQKAELEHTKGTSCPNSRPGDGPRRALRNADAQRFAFASEFVNSRIATVKGNLSALDADLVKIAGNNTTTIDPKTGTRNDFMRSLGRRLDLTVTGFNAFRTDPQLRQIRADLNTRAGKTVFPTTKGGTFSCPDPQLQTALRGVVRAIDGLPELRRPQVAAVEGSEATIEAFRRLTASIHGVVSFRLPPSADDLRSLQQQAVRSVSDKKNGSGGAAGGASLHAAKAQYTQPTGLSKRDSIPLAIAIFVDLCLLLVSMGRPLNTYKRIKLKMREAADGPVYQILQRFYIVFEDEQRKDSRVFPMIEVLHHAIFETNGRYHAAIPLSVPANATDTPAREREVRVLTSLFASLEPFGVYRHTPYITARMLARKKLEAQASLFADAPDFRVYTFGNNRWPEMILGAVMGAAKRVEQEKRHRQKLEDALSAREASRATASGAKGPLARTTDELPSGPLPHAGLPKATRSNSKNPSSRLRDWRASKASKNSKPIDEALKAKFGPHAAAAQRQQDEAEYLASVPTLRGRSDATQRRKRRVHMTDDIEVPSNEEVANSNTAPVEASVVNGAASRLKAVAGQVARLAPSMAGFESRPRRLRAKATEAAATLEPQQTEPNDENGTGAVANESTVTLTRETATITVPNSQASVPAEILDANQTKASATPINSELGDNGAPASNAPEADSTLLLPPSRHASGPTPDVGSEAAEDAEAIDAAGESNPDDLDRMTALARRLKPTLPPSAAE